MSPLALLKTISLGRLPGWQPTTDELRDLAHLGHIQLVHGKRNKASKPSNAFHDSLVLFIKPAGFAALTHSA